MGEMLLGHLRGDLPVVIVRPSIITSILNEPLPGWMEGIRYVRDQKDSKFTSCRHPIILH
jgi:hypothetical protein